MISFQAQSKALNERLDFQKIISEWAKHSNEPKSEWAN
jgi:hypothetical protein